MKIQLVSKLSRLTSRLRRSAQIQHQSKSPKGRLRIMESAQKQEKPKNPCGPKPRIRLKEWNITCSFASSLDSADSSFFSSPPPGMEGMEGMNIFIIIILTPSLYPPLWKSQEAFSCQLRLTTVGHCGASKTKVHQPEAEAQAWHAISTSYPTRNTPISWLMKKLTYTRNDFFGAHTKSIYE